MTLDDLIEQLLELREFHRSSGTAVVIMVTRMRPEYDDGDMVECNIDRVDYVNAKVEILS